MKKIISLFKRNYEGNRLVVNEVVDVAEWVQLGEGVATRKWDGTCCMIKSGVLYKRFDAKNGKKPPENFIPAQDPDPITGHWPGWVPVGVGPEDSYFREGFAGLVEPKDGTYELCGPKVQSNPEKFENHILILHGAALINAPRDFDGIREFLFKNDIEGIVWHHEDGRMVKIKKKDFGFKR